MRTRTALVTGGGRGIGKAIAKSLAGPGTFVVVAARTKSQLEATASELKALGGDSVGVVMDLTSESSVASGMQTLRGAIDHLDVLVNNAGVGGGQPVEGSEIDRWRRTIDTNITGTYLVTREALPLMSSEIGRAHV